MATVPAPRAAIALAGVAALALVLFAIEGLSPEQPGEPSAASPAPNSPPEPAGEPLHEVPAPTSAVEADATGREAAHVDLELVTELVIPNGRVVPIDDHTRDMLAASGETLDDVRAYYEWGDALDAKRKQSVSWAFTTAYVGDRSERVNLLYDAVLHRLPGSADLDEGTSEEVRRVVAEFWEEFQGERGRVDSPRPPRVRDGIFRFRVSAESCRLACGEQKQKDALVPPVAWRTKDRLVALLGPPAEEPYYLEPLALAR